MKCSLSVLVAAALGCAPFLTGCGSAVIAAKEYMGIPKREQMVARVEDARNAQTVAKEQFASALDEFLAVTKADGGDLEAKYRKLNAEYEASVKSAKAVSSRIADVEQVSGKLFAEWQREIGEYTTPSLKAASQAQLAETKEQYARLLASMKNAEAKMQPVLATFKDQVMFLKHNLNARAIASLEGTAGQVSADVERLIKDMNASIDEANAFIGQLKSAK
ncbi:MAG: DUF2959 domain-containing protein [Phycisphaerae bacterium]|nr:DUF2959 domain-containing protein [Phycisphaerae bacterium]